MGLTYSSFSTSAQLPLLGDGEYLVGCADIMLTGDTADPGVFARIFYPSAKKLDSNESVPEEVIEYPHTPLYSSFSNSSKLSKTANNTADTSNGQISNGIDTSKPVEDDVKYPTAVFSHGISGNRLCYTTFCSSLASYGFVVAALEHRDKSSSWTYHLELDSDGVLFENPVLMDTFPDGESEFKERNIQLHHRVAECVKAVQMFEDLNLGKCAKFSDVPKLQGVKIVHGHEFDWSQFKGRLDTTKASVIGHSFGGAAAVAASALSTHFTASVVLDGWLYPIEDTLYSQVDKPVLMLNARGELDPNFTVHAILEIVVTFLRNCFQSVKAATDISQLLAKYDSNFVFEGTDLNLKVDTQKKKETSQTSNI